MTQDFTAFELCQELVTVNSGGLFRDIFPNISCYLTLFLFGGVCELQKKT